MILDDYRDEHGIICQIQEGETPRLDGGDSAARMGISALENQDDRTKLSEFTKAFQLVRHPHQNHITKEGKVFNDPKHTSRDQLVQFCVKETAYTARVAQTYYNKWFINRDILLPDVKLYLYRCAWRNPPLWLKVIGTAWMWLSLIYNTKIKSDEEMNQFTCMMIRMGPAWSRRLIAWHPDIKAAIRSYWQRPGYNRPHELGEILIRKLEST